MNKNQIITILDKWWKSNKTCSGKPHCDVEECDLCFTCFSELCNMFGITYVNGELIKNNNEVKE